MAQPNQSRTYPVAASMTWSAMSLARIRQRTSANCSLTEAVRLWDGDSDPRSAVTAIVAAPNVGGRRHAHLEDIKSPLTLSFRMAYSRLFERAVVPSPARFVPPSLRPSRRIQIATRTRAESSIETPARARRALSPEAGSVGLVPTR